MGGNHEGRGGGEMSTAVPGVAELPPLPSAVVPLVPGEMSIRGEAETARVVEVDGGSDSHTTS